MDRLMTGHVCNGCPLCTPEFFKPIQWHYSIPPQSNGGWVCPKCGGVFAPTTPGCFNCVPNKDTRPSDVLRKGVEHG